MINNCPKCDAELISFYKDSKTKNYCPVCKGHVYSVECYACGKKYWMLSIHESKPWNNHKCDETYINKKEASRNSVEDREGRTPSLLERLKEGYKMLNEDYEDDKS